MVVSGMATMRGRRERRRPRRIGGVGFGAQGGYHGRCRPPVSTWFCVLCVEWAVWIARRGYCGRAASVGMFAVQITAIDGKAL